MLIDAVVYLWFSTTLVPPTFEIIWDCVHIAWTLQKKYCSWVVPPICINIWDPTDANSLSCSTGPHSPQLPGNTGGFTIFFFLSSFSGGAAAPHLQRHKHHLARSSGGSSATKGNPFPNLDSVSRHSAFAIHQLIIWIYQNQPKWLHIWKYMSKYISP